MFSIIDKDNDVKKKICKYCNEIKSDNEFYPKDAKCKKCKSIYTKQKSHTIKEHYKHLIKENNELRNKLILFYENKNESLEKKIMDLENKINILDKNKITVDDKIYF